MRFTNVRYSHTDKADDVLEVKFYADFKEGLFEDNQGSIEFWVQDNHIELVLIDLMTNELVELKEEENTYLRNMFQEFLLKRL